MTPQELSARLASGTKTVIFQKADSSIRRLRCTRDQTIINQTAKLRKNPAAFPYDVDTMLDRLDATAIATLTTSTLLPFGVIKDVLRAEAHAAWKRNGGTVVGAPNWQVPPVNPNTNNVKVFATEIGDWRTIAADRVIAIEDY